MDFRVFPVSPQDRPKVTMPEYFSDTGVIRAGDGLPSQASRADGGLLSGAERIVQSVFLMVMWEPWSGGRLRDLAALILSLREYLLVAFEVASS